MNGMAIRPIHGLALCAGIGGLELGIKLATGDAYRCVGYVEREAFAAAVLVARMEDAALDRAPIWDDLTTFDGRPWRGRVDLVTAGYPCQPFSVAGNRAGESDPRHLWPHVRRIIAEVQPSLVFLENVPGHISLGFDTVLGEIADLGFDAEWCVLGADDVGAPHRRKRLWALAYRDPDGRELLGRSGVLDGERSACWHDADGCGGARLEHAARGDGVEGRESGSKAAARRSGSAGPVVGDAERERFVRGRDPIERGREGASASPGLRQRLEADEHGVAGEGCGDVPNAALLAEREPHDETSADARRDAWSSVGGRGCWPPPPNDLPAWERVQAELTPSFCRVADGIPDRVDRLRALGNGVVPLAAAHAFRTLATRIASNAEGREMSAA